MNKIKILSLFLAFSFGTYSLSKKTFGQETSVSFQIFYDELSPYGQWVDHPSYGYIWMPGVEAGFSPYATAGHWVLTVYGWTWVSDYPWGWAPFHYGRWNYDTSYGWFWYPQNEWGPAWVIWRGSGDYYGWAPMGYGTTITITLGSRYNVPHDHWRFVRRRDITSPTINNYYVDRSTNITIIKNTTVIQNTHVDNERHTTYVSGPHREEVQKITGTSIQPVIIRENNKPGQNLKNGELEIYRPQIQQINANDPKIAPKKVMKMEELKSAPQRNPENKTQESDAPNKTLNPNEPERKSGRQQQPPNAPGNNNTKPAPEPTNQNLPRQAPERKPEAQPHVAPPAHVTPTPIQHTPPAQPVRPNPTNNTERRQQAPQTPDNNRPAPQQNKQKQNIHPPKNQAPPQRQDGNKNKQ